MRRGRRVSGRYRGSRRGVGFLIPTLVILCIIAAAALYIINENMTFTKDGKQFVIGQTEEDTETVDANLIIEEPEETPAEEVAPPAASQPSESAFVKGKFIPIGTVKSAEHFADALAGIPAGVNTLVFEVKAEDGTLAFASDSPIAVTAEVSGENAVLENAVARAKGAGYKVAFLMSCFKDNEAARKNQQYAIRLENKTLWLDWYSVRWLSAYSSGAQEYLTDCIKKLAAFSPDEIILSNVSFPAVGKCNLIGYDKTLGTKQEMLQSFIADAKTAAGGIKLSAVYENYNDAKNPEGGQTADDFAVFENIYINRDAGEFTLDFNAGKTRFEGKNKNLIPVGKDAIGDNFIVK